MSGEKFYPFFRMLIAAVLFFGVLQTALAQEWSDLPVTPDASGHARIIGTYTLPPTEIADINPGIDMGSIDVARKNGLVSTSNPGIGSAMVAVPGRLGEFYMMTDRGPNFDNVNGAGKVYGKVFPLPGYTPSIVQVRLDAGQIKIIKAIPLTGSDGKPVTGLGNNKDDEPSYADPHANPLPFNASGIDTEALQILSDGCFLIAEEYGPSVLVADADGKVLIRYVPAGKSYQGANYPVKAILPALFKERRSNRGFENLALTPDGGTAYAILQSPMGNPKDKAYTDVRLVRILRMDVRDPLDAKITGMFAVMQSAKGEYPETAKQADLKYSDAAALNDTTLLLLERAEKKVRLIEADLRGATDLMTSPLADNLQLERAADDLNSLGISAAATHVVFDSRDVFLQLQNDKLEGLSVLTPAVVAVSNDNDFGVGENVNQLPSQVWIIRLGKSLENP